MINSTLIVASFVSGLVLGGRRFMYGLAGLLAILAVTSSLPFQIGLPNLALTPAYLLGLLIAGFALRPTDGRAPVLWDGDARAAGPRLLGWVALTSLTIVVATGLSIVRRFTSPLRPRFDGNVTDLFLFAPPGFPGEAQAAFVALSGPLLFTLALAALAPGDHRVLVRRAFAAGAWIAVLTPLLQIAALTPWVRPDHGTYEGTIITGLVGFFQDPHSYAAYLVVAVAFAAGVGVGHFRAAARAPTIAYGALAAAAGIVLLYTNSRAGLIAALAALVMLALLTVSSPGMSKRAKRWRRILVVALIVGGIGVAGVLASEPARDALYDQLVRLGNARMWEPLRTDPLEILAGRTARLQKAQVLLRTNPLWGVGPNRFQSTEVSLAGIRPEVIAVHPHNYYVQRATEYGIPAALCFFGLLAVILGYTIRGSYRAEDPLDRGVIAGVAAAQAGVLIMSLVGHPMLLAEIQAVFWTMSALGVATALSTTRADQSRSSKLRPTSKPKYGGGEENAGAFPPE